MILKVVYYLLFIITNIYGLYFITIAIPVFFKKRNKSHHQDKLHHFCILIPARNEEQVIGNLITSIQKVSYPKDKYEIIVVLNNSTDNTKEISLSHKVNLIECQNKITCKGDALKEAFNILKPRKDIDAYLILDADNLIDKNFLLHMNNSLNNGYLVAQGFRDTKNISANWISSSYALYYYIQNYFFNKARTTMNSSATINGTGFIIKKEVIDQIEFNTKTLTEDMEFSGICALNNIKIDFVEKAITYDEQPTNFKVSWNQRKRWSKGCLQCFKNYSLKLLKNNRKNKSCLDLFIIYASPIIQVLTIIMLIISLIINKDSLIITPKKILNTLIFTAIIYLLQVILCIYTLIINKKPLKKYLSGILMFPIFIITWIPINIIILFQKNIKWKHIPHTHNITIDELQ